MLTTLLNTAWMWHSAGEARRFRRAVTRVRQTQLELLKATLAANADCQYGREFGFATITSPTEFQRRVPVCDYESLRPRLEAIAAGQRDILTTEPVLMVEPTGGSTGGTRLIPYTATLRRQFQRAIAAWMCDVLEHYPAVRRGRAYWSISPLAQRPRATPGGLRIGFDNDTEYLAGWQRWLAGRLQAVPSTVARVRDYERFQYCTLAWLLAAADLSLISVWSPTFLTTLFERLPVWQFSLIQDLNTGRLTWPDRKETITDNPGDSLPGPRDPARSQELRRLMDSDGATPEFLRKCWPGLSLVSCWGDAAAERFVPALRNWLPTASFQPKGLLATEGVVSVPVSGRDGAALAIRSHVFEFVPADREPEMNGRPLWAWELEAGSRYRVLITTGGGLYRYDLQDVIEVVGFLGECPCIRFLGRSGPGSDLVGEKLHEQHVREAVTQGCGALGLIAEFALVAPETHPTAGYRAILVCPGWRQLTSDRRELELRLAAEIEQTLCMNSQYRYALGLGQLRPLAAVLLDMSPEDAWRLYERECRRRGQRGGDIKPTTLARDPGWREIFMPVNLLDNSGTGR